MIFVVQTCKLLNDISRNVRAVWISQYYQYVAQRMHSVRLEEPLDSYSAQELERWVLVRRSADVGWRREDMKCSRNRWVTQKDIGCTYLVPGGRWLLVGGLDGSVTAYDLDASSITGRPLTPPDDQDKRQPICRIVIDIDSPDQSPNLTFTMALSVGVPFCETCNICGIT